MKFIHTSDWLLGMGAVQIPEAASEFRKARLEVVNNVIDTAHREEADFIIAVGDIFASNYIDPDLAKNLVNKLKKLEITTYIIPGGYDRYSADSIYRTDIFQNLPANIKILTQKKPEKIPGINTVLYPCPNRNDNNERDPVAWIPTGNNNNQYRIGAAHGIFQGLGSDNAEEPVIATGAAEKKLDYLALGHLRETVKYNSRIYYSGSPESTSFDEQGSGQVLLVEIEEPGDRPVVKEIDTGYLNWEFKRLTVDEPYEDALQEVNKLIDKIDNPGQSLLKIELAGYLSLEGLQAVKGILESRKEDFLYLELTEQLQVDVLEERINELAGQNTLTGGVIEDLKKIIATNFEEEDKVVQEQVAAVNEIPISEQFGVDDYKRALMELVEILEEVDR